MRDVLNNPLAILMHLHMHVTPKSFISTKHSKVVSSPAIVNISTGRLCFCLCKKYAITKRERDRFVIIYGEITASVLPYSCQYTMGERRRSTTTTST